MSQPSYTGRSWTPVRQALTSLVRGGKPMDSTGGLDPLPRTVYLFAREIGAVSRGGRPKGPILPATSRGYNATARSGTDSLA